jgi:hypothetical protein
MKPSSALLPLWEASSVQVTRATLEDVKEHVQRQGSQWHPGQCLTWPGPSSTMRRDRGYFIGQKP